ncbi:hypothetical protein LDENG_00285320 [Lucifuga dentata]|nr:hypothetical protein LDENG_00285320 [Lucifuga dentata]
MTAAESRISDSEDTITTCAAKLAKAESRLAAAMDKIDDLENRGRRCNTWIIGLPEGTEGSNPISFFKTWLPELVKVSFKGDTVKLDRCHQAPTSRISKPAGSCKQGGRRNLCPTMAARSSYSRIFLLLL